MVATEHIVSQPTSPFDHSEPLPGTAAESGEPETRLATPRPEDPYEGAVPPGYDWPTHGGYLGCLLGIMLSCIVGGFVASLVDVFDFEHQIRGLPNVLLVVATFLVALALLARIGWLLGRRFYREYAAKPTWGESDVYRPEWETPAHDSREADEPSDQPDATPDATPDAGVR
jgi:hypothetical protein